MYRIEFPKDLTDFATSIGYFWLVRELLRQTLYLTKTVGNNFEKTRIMNWKNQIKSPIKFGKLRRYSLVRFQLLFQILL